MYFMSYQLEEENVEGHCPMCQAEIYKLTLNETDVFLDRDPEEIFISNAQVYPELDIHLSYELRWYYKIHKCAGGK